MEDKGDRTLVVTVIDGHGIKTNKTVMCIISLASCERQTGMSTSDDPRHPVWGRNLTFRAEELDDSDEEMSVRIIEENGVSGDRD